LGHSHFSPIPPERRIALEKKIEREWKSVACPDGAERISVMCEWDIISEKGRILKRTLRQIDCFNPKLAKFGGADCDWRCEEVIGKRRR
jgi:hypothetical protein